MIQGRKNSLIFHRVVKFSDDYIFVKGDNENYTLKINRNLVLGIYGNKKLRIEDIPFKKGIVRLFSKTVDPYRFTLIIQGNYVKEFRIEKLKVVEKSGDKAIILVR